MIDVKINKFYDLIKNRLVKNSFYTGLALAFIGFVPFIFNFLVARSFGKEILGSINMTLSFCLVITIFITNFFGTSANKFLAEYRGREQLNHFIYTFQIMIYGSLAVVSSISLIIFFNWDFFSIKFSLPYNLLLPIISFIFLRSFYILFRRAFYGMDLVKSYAINEICSDILMIIIISYLCYTKDSMLLIHSYLISYLFFLLLSVLTLKKNYDQITSSLHFQKKFSKRDILLSFSKYGYISMIGTVASTGTGYISVIITGTFLNTSDAGLYSSVLTVISILTFIPKLFTQVFLPEFSKLFGQGNKKRITEIIKKSSKLMFLIASVVCTILYIYTENILAVFGEEFLKADTILKIIIPSVFVRMISIPFISFLSGTKYIIYPNVGGIIILLVSVVLWIILVPELKLKGIAIGYTIGIIVGIGYQIFMAILKMRTFK